MGELISEHRERRAPLQGAQIEERVVGSCIKQELAEGKYHSKRRDGKRERTAEWSGRRARISGRISRSSSGGGAGEIHPRARGGITSLGGSGGGGSPGVNVHGRKATRSQKVEDAGSDDEGGKDVLETLNKTTTVESITGIKESRLKRTAPGDWIRPAQKILSCKDQTLYLPPQTGEKKKTPQKTRVCLEELWGSHLASRRRTLGDQEKKN